MSFSEASLSKKFQELNNTQQSVQTLSLWLIHHRRHSLIIVKSWLKELTLSGNCDRKLTFIYLANDILQNSRKKGPEFMKDFLIHLADAIENTAKYADTKMRFTLERILNIWKDRKIYPDEKINEFKRILHSTKFIGLSPTEPDASKTSKSKSKTPNTKSTKPETNNDRGNRVTQASENSMKRKHEDHKTVETTPIKQPAGKLSLREEVAKEFLNNSNTIAVPDTLDLIKMLQDLEKSASSDAVVREKIAELPAKVSDLNGVKNVKEKKEALDLLTPVNEAALLLDNYNSRLQQELSNRKQTALQFAAFIKHQRALADNDQKMIEEWQRKLKQVRNVKHELQIHLESLPDLSSIEEAAILTPLPSAGDLFSS